MDILVNSLSFRLQSDSIANSPCFQHDPEWQNLDDMPQPTPDTEGRLENLGWCSCGGCIIMQTLKESVCCREMDVLEHNFHIGINCILEVEEVQR